jgi:ComF family protein
VTRLGNLAGRLGLENLLEFLYPSSCLNCNRYIDHPGELICEECWHKATVMPLVICAACGQLMPDGAGCINCLSPQKPLPAFTLGHYLDPLKNIIHQMKYHGYRKLSRELGERLVGQYRSVLESFDADLIVPIPLDYFREWKRGFNQAALLSDIIGERLNLPVVEQLLRKVRRTKDQTKLDPVEREENMRGAFRADSEKLAGKRILLVDDVVTTGATLREARRALDEAGAEAVLALTVAAAGYDK